MMRWNSDWAWWQSSLMWIAMFAFAALLIWVVYALVNGAIGQPKQHGDDARRILDERLARGEIDTGEYHRLRDAIDGRSGARNSQ